MKTPTPLTRALLCGGLFLLGAVTGSAQLISYNFNQNGTQATNGGSLGSNYNLNTLADDTTPTNFFTAGGMGVSGANNDRALDFGQSVASMGGDGAYGELVSETNSDLSPLSTLTIAGWYKIDSSADIAGGFIFRNNSGSPERGGWGFEGVSADRFQLSIGNGTTTVTARSSAGSYTANSGEWVFFAVTWDGGLANSNTQFYVGDFDTAVSGAGTVDLAETMAADTQILRFGKSNNSSGTWDGLLDNIVVYDSVLNATEIENLRLSAIPEPTSAALVAGAGLILALRRRR